MKKTCLTLSACLWIFIVWAPQAGCATKAYTTDTEEIALRSGPTLQHRVLIMVPPSSGVELLKGNEWSRVRFTTPDGNTKEGWVQSRFLEARPPESTLVKGLESENAALKEQLAGLEREKAELARREKDLFDKLSGLETAHESLKSGSSNYLKLKDEFDSTKNTLCVAQENIQQLIQENENLKLAQKIRWFTSGALVLFFGWFIGWFTGRRQKNRRSTYYR